jgi:AhpD family alkylhydroperoxidase
MKGHSMITETEKALIAVGASVASGCQPCTEHTVALARTAGAGERSLALAVETALAVRGSATRTMDRWAAQCQGTRPPLDPAFHTENRRIAELAAVAASFAVNSVPDLEAHLEAARECGATPEEIQITIGMSRLIKKTAEEKLAALIGESSGAAAGCGPAPARPGGCGCG